MNEHPVRITYKIYIILYEASSLYSIDAKPKNKKETLCTMPMMVMVMMMMRAVFTLMIIGSGHRTITPTVGKGKHLLQERA